MYTIYFNAKPLFITNDSTPELQAWQQKGGTVTAKGLERGAIKHIIQEMQEDNTEAGIIMHSDMDALLKAVKEQFTLIQAAGGFVHTPDDHILFIFRRGKWDLPKGKLDEGEDLPTCAVREVTEETGLKDIQLQQPLLITYHTYYEGTRHILKESHWYTMLAEHPNTLAPQAEEDILECKWIAITETAAVLNNTHPSIIDVVRAGTEYLKSKKPD